MAILAEYHKPTSLAQAFELLSDSASRRVPLAGGAHLVGVLETRERRDIEGVVDLAELGLSFIEQDGAYLHVGAMTTITDLIEHPLSAELAGGILPDTARYEGPLNLRNAATVGGLVALAEPDSETYAALLDRIPSARCKSSPAPSLQHPKPPASSPGSDCLSVLPPPAMPASPARPWTGVSSPPSLSSAQTASRPGLNLPMAAGTAPPPV